MFFKAKEGKPKWRNLTRESRKNLEERFFYLTEKFAKEDLTDEEREKIKAELNFISAIMPERVIRKGIDLSGILAAAGSAVAMILSGLFSYWLNNRGLFDKKGENLLNPTNFKSKY